MSAHVFAILELSKYGEMELLLIRLKFNTFNTIKKYIESINVRILYFVGFYLPSHLRAHYICVYSFYTFVYLIFIVQTIFIR